MALPGQISQTDAIRLIAASEQIDRRRQLISDVAATGALVQQDQPQFIADVPQLSAAFEEIQRGILDPSRIFPDLPEFRGSFESAIPFRDIRQIEDDPQQPIRLENVEFRREERQQFSQQRQGRLLDESEVIDESPVLRPRVATGPFERLTAEQLAAGMAGAERFSTPEFNVDTIKALIDSHITAGDLTNEELLASQLQSLLAQGVEKALTSGLPQQDVIGVFLTLGDALRGLGIAVNDGARLSEIANQAGFGLVSRQGLEEISFIPEDANVLAANIFGPGLGDIVNRNTLSTQEITEISREFARKLDFLIGQRDTTRQTFINLTTWLDTNVANDTLRAALESQSKRFETDLTRIETSVRLKAVPELIPLSESRAILLDTDVGAIFGKEIGLALGAITLSTDIDVRDQLIDRLVDTTNIVVRNNKLQKVVAGRRVSARISKNNPDGTAKTPIELFRELTILGNELPKPTSQFIYLPVRTESQPQDNRKIVDQLRADFGNAALQKRKAERKLISHPGTLEKYGHISIITQRSEGKNQLEIVIPPNASMEDFMKLVQSLLMEDGTLTDVHNKTLLIIKKGTTTMAQVIQIILEEQRRMLGNEFRLGYKPVSSVGGSYVGGALMMLLKVPLGETKPFRSHIPPSGIPLIHPANLVMHRTIGAMYRPVGGSLVLPTVRISLVDQLPKPLFHSAAPFSIQITPESQARLRGNNEDRVLPEGGNIFGDIFGVVGNVVKTVASVPLALAGAVFGGELNPQEVQRYSIPARG